MNSQPVVSKISNDTYGIVYSKDSKLHFRKHKAIKINQNKSVPKVCSEIQYTYKEISKDDFEKYFRKTNMTEILILEMMEEK